MRIISWNINGIAPFLQKPITSFFRSKEFSKKIHSGISSPSLRRFLKRHNWPEILFLQEVKIAASDTKTQDNVRGATNTQSRENSTRFQCAWPKGNGKVYGVCSIIRNDVSTSYQAKFRTVDWDKEERISVVELKTPNFKLALFNIYAVNGTDNPYRNLSTGAIQGTRHDIKLMFHRFLMEESKSLEARGWDVLLAGDFNVAPNVMDGYPKLRSCPKQHVVNRIDFHNRILGGSGDGIGQGLNGVDIWRKMHENERRYTYFPRGKAWGSSCDRVDYFIAGRGTWTKGLIKSCAILDSEVERGPSDHVTVWVDADLAAQDLTEAI
ncbi:DNase I-like protein [Corynespora cassiicola Philippines]|uniref:DNase I-like protein n=1 Tax=Corynespora cassiicola Philippines TaxID=1448308 RepID=A0A2T2NIC5_CORCC|nr:DNase I-like protein [Corynespora cassiicola Philippines]